MHLKTTIAALGVATAATISASAGAAATYNINLEHGGTVATSSTANSLTFTIGDMTATFFGRYLAGPVGSTELTEGVDNAAHSMTRWSGGVGIRNVWNSHVRDAEHTVDGKSLLDFHDYVGISFTYKGNPVDVMLKSLGFGYIAQGYSHVNASYAILGDTNNSGGINVGDKILTFGNAAANVDLTALALKDSYFGVVAGEKGSWKLRTVSFEYAPPPPPAVPLPAAGWMLLAGLGGIAAMKRRRKAG